MLTNAELERRARGRAVIRAYQHYMAEQRAALLAALDAGAADRAHYHARDLAHCAGYVAWVQAKLDGHPCLAGPSARPWAFWDAPYPTSAASTIGAPDDGDGV